MEFTNEELALLRPFDTSYRSTLLWELRQALPDIYQPDAKRAMRSAIGKLEGMTDGEFDALGLDVGNSYYDWEDYE